MMPATEAEKNAQTALEIFEMAMMGIVANLGVSANEAAKIILQQAARNMTPAAIKEALKK
jgi:hypothetical protein